ncbi:MAG: hypothetical protein ABSF55_00410 [Candidatus Staskawiczbacteria bacterium]|jgi:hypothetical protein
MAKLNFIQRRFNKKLNKLQYKGKKYPYVISFENTDMDWYTSPLINFMANKYCDMSFSAEDSSSQYSPAGMVQIFKIKDFPMFLENGDVLWNLEGEIKKSEYKNIVAIEEPKKIVTSALSDMLLFFHKGIRGAGWEKDGGFEIFENNSGFAICIKGFIKKSSMRTYDFVYMMNTNGEKAILILSTYLPWNPSSTVLKDIKNIATSIKF